MLPATVPLPEGVMVGNMLCLSGQRGKVPGTLRLVDGGSALACNGLALGARVEIECIAAG